MLQALFFILKIALAIWDLLWLQHNLGVFVLFLWKMLQERLILSHFLQII